MPIDLFSNKMWTRKQNQKIVRGQQHKLQHHCMNHNKSPLLIIVNT